MKTRELPGLRKHILFACGLMLFFFAYYIYTAQRLPMGSGPDEGASFGAVAFIYQNGRLAVLPDDEKALKFSPHYGTTRALRPPLSFIVSAIVAKAVTGDKDNLRITARYGGSLLCAITVMLTFLALGLLTRSGWAGLTGALLIGFMPQFVFLAAYCNDDTGAIFSVTLAVFSMVVIRHYGIHIWSAILAGLSIGLILLSKYTTWLFLPFFGLFLLVVLLAQRERFLLYSVLIVCAAFVGGGWWIAFNMYHYGFDDPLLFKVIYQYAEKYGQFSPDIARGYASLGLGFYELIIGNYKEFINASYHSTIGNLDLLRLRMGPLQYNLYLVPIVIAGLTVLLSVIRLPLALRSPQGWNNAETQQIGFELLLFSAIVFQIYMYVWTNLHHDAQAQGKYLIPVFLPLWLLAFSGLLWTKDRMNSMAENNFWSWVDLPKLNVYNLLAMLTIGVTLFTHWHAVTRYVLPYYRSQAYFLGLDDFKKLDLKDTSIIQHIRSLEFEAGEGEWRFTGVARDPKILFDPNVCRSFGKNTLMQMQVVTKQADLAVLYVDDGTGFHEKRSDRIKYPRGEQTFVFAVGADHCRRLRFDPMTKPGVMTIKSIGIAPLMINPTNYPRY